MTSRNLETYNRLKEQAEMDVDLTSAKSQKAMLDAYRPKLWGRYGFSDGYNLDRNWWDKDVIGIDTGCTLLAIENHRTGLVQKLFMKHPSAGLALKRIGFK